MKKMKLFLAVFMSLCLTACGGNAANKSTPEAALENTMESLKALDLEAFNDHTDNYITTHRNLIGVPVQREYRVFNELMQPGLKGVKHYRWNDAFSRRSV